VKEQTEIQCDANTAAEYLWDAGSATERDKSIKKSEILEQLTLDSYLCYLTTKSLVIITPNKIHTFKLPGQKKRDFCIYHARKLMKDGVTIGIGCSTDQSVPENPVIIGILGDFSRNM
jgi:hypothetical protein